MRSLCVVALIACGGSGAASSDEITLEDQPVIKDGVRSTFSLDLGDAAALDRAVRAIRIRFQLARITGHVSAARNELVVDLAGNDAETISRALDLVARTGRFELRFAEPGSTFMKTIAEHVTGDPEAARRAITSTVDNWTTSERKQLVDWTLRASDREQTVSVEEARALGCMRTGPRSADGRVTCRVSGRTVIESYLVELAIRDTRFAVPPDRMLAYEHVTPERTAPYWRTYLVEREVIAESIRNATAARDQNELPAVQITLDRAGTATLAAATTRHVGRKLVFLIDHRVASAPIIEEPITEGRLWIPIRRGEPARMEHEARELAIVLRSGALPGAVREETRGVLVDGVAKYEGP